MHKKVLSISIKKMGLFTGPATKNYIPRRPFMQLQAPYRLHISIITGRGGEDNKKGGRVTN
jgi:hypothetical protein